MELLDRIAQQVEAATAASGNTEKIVKLVEEASDLQDEIEGMMEMLKTRIGRFNRIKQYELVEAMKLANTGEYKTLDRKIKVKLDNYVSGSLPKEEHDREFALGELIRVGGQRLIKTGISVDFPKSMHNAASVVFGKLADLCKEIAVDGEDVEPTMTEGVHAASLQAFAKELIKTGSDVKLDVLGLSSGQVAKFEFYDENGKKKKKLSLEDVK
jgi:hypothetical protein